MALLAAILLLLVMSGLAVALTTSGRIEVAMGDNEELYAGARAAAESGLNHAAAIILGLTANPAYDLNQLLTGPDGAVDGDPAAAVNADNGLMTHLIPGATPWPVAPGSAYTYEIRLFDDDDPVLHGGAVTAEALAAMGPPPAAPEDGSGVNDVNHRLVIQSIGYGPRGTRVQLEQMLTPIMMPALLINGDLTLGGTIRIIGSQGSVHANGNLTVQGTGPDVEQNATASGTLTADEGWNPGGVKSSGTPMIPAPDINAIDYFDEADFVLTSDGRITNKDGSFVYCDASGTGNEDNCLKVIPSGFSPPHTSPFGWSFQAASGWTLSLDSVVSATYYAQHDVTITGNAGGPLGIALTVIAEGNVVISGNPRLTPESESELMFVTDKDLSISGEFEQPVNVEGRILVREQIGLVGNATLAGLLIVKNVPSVSTVVTVNVVAGSTTLSYNGLIETMSYTVSGWKETQ
jgi:hypothetical protein